MVGMIRQSENTMKYDKTWFDYEYWKKSCIVDFCLNKMDRSNSDLQNVLEKEFKKYFSNDGLVKEFLSLVDLRRIHETHGLFHYICRQIQSSSSTKKPENWESQKSGILFGNKTLFDEKFPPLWEKIINMKSPISCDWAIFEKIHDVFQFHKEFQDVQHPLVRRRCLTPSKPFIGIVLTSFLDECKDVTNEHIFHKMWWTPPLDDLWICFYSWDEYVRYLPIVTRLKKHHFFHIVVLDSFPLLQTTTYWSSIQQYPWGHTTEGQSSFFILPHLTHALIPVALENFFHPVSDDLDIGGTKLRIIWNALQDGQQISLNKICFLHSGDLGDILYSTVWIQMISESSNRILFIKYDPSMKFSSTKIKFVKNIVLLREIFRHYSLFHNVFIWNGERIDYDMDHFRKAQVITNYTNNDLIDFAKESLPPMTQCQLFWWTPWVFDTPFVSSVSMTNRDIVIFRSIRYHGIFSRLFFESFCQRYQDRIVFIGLPFEHDLFQKECHVSIPYLESSDFLSICHQIQTATLVIGNGTFLMSLSANLRWEQPILLETWVDSCQCLFEHVIQFGHTDNILKYRNKTFYIHDFWTEHALQTLDSMFLHIPYRFPICPEDTAFLWNRQFFHCRFQGISLPSLLHCVEGRYLSLWTCSMTSRQEWKLFKEKLTVQLQKRTPQDTIMLLFTLDSTLFQDEHLCHDILSFCLLTEIENCILLECPHPVFLQYPSFLVWSWIHQYSIFLPFLHSIHVFFLSYTSYTSYTSIITDQTEKMESWFEWFVTNLSHSCPINNDNDTINVYYEMISSSWLHRFFVVYSTQFDKLWNFCVMSISD